MGIGSQGLMTAALLDTLGRFVGNVGVPAAIAFLMLWQITPRLDRIAETTSQLQTTLQVETIACAQPRLPAPAP